MNESALDFHRTQTMSGDVEHIVYAAHDPDVTVFIAAGAVGGEVGMRNLAPVLLLVALVVAEDGPQHRGPRTLDDEQAAGVRRNGVALAIDDLRFDAGQWACRGTGFRRDGAGQGRDHD